MWKAQPCTVHHIAVYCSSVYWCTNSGKLVLIMLTVANAPQATCGESPCISTGSCRGPVTGPGWSVQDLVCGADLRTREHPAGCHKREDRHWGREAPCSALCKSVAAVNFTIWCHLTTEFLYPYLAFSLFKSAPRCQTGIEYLDCVTLKAQTHWWETLFYIKVCHMLSSHIFARSHSEPICVNRKVMPSAGTNGIAVSVCVSVSRNSWNCVVWNTHISRNHI